MKWFDRQNSERDSLSQFGVLALGERESLRFTPVEHSYEEIDRPARLYRKVA